MLSFFIQLFYKLAKRVVSIDPTIFSEGSHANKCSVPMSSGMVGKMMEDDQSPVRVVEVQAKLAQKVEIMLGDWPMYHSMDCNSLMEILGLHYLLDRIRLHYYNLLASHPWLVAYNMTHSYHKMPPDDRKYLSNLILCSRRISRPGAFQGRSSASYLQAKP